MLRKPLNFNRYHWQEIKPELLSIKHTSCLISTKNIFFRDTERVSLEEFKNTPIKQGSLFPVLSEYEIESRGIYKDEDIIGSVIVVSEHIHHGYPTTYLHRWEVIKDNENKDIKILQFKDTSDYTLVRYKLIRDLIKKC